MALTQRFGIKYPFSNENDEEIYVDLNDTIEDSVKSKVLHVLFTPKGQRLRNPDFGTDLIKYIFEPSDGNTYDHLIEDIRNEITRYVPEVSFDSIQVYDDDIDGHSKIVVAEYSVNAGNETKKTKVAVKI